MSIKSYTSVAASNISLFPENQAPSTVNDGMRTVQADIRSWYVDAQWIDRGDSGISRASASSFKITSDVTSEYVAGRRLKLYDATTLYGVISSSSYSAPDTTINVTTDSGNLTSSLTSVSVGILTPTNKSFPSFDFDTVTVSGAAQFKGTATISGAAVCKTTLTVEGAATISGAATFMTTQTVSGAAVFKTTATIEGAATISGAAVFKTTATIEGAATISGAAVCKTSLTVEGTLSASATANFNVGIKMVGGSVLSDYVTAGTFTPAIKFGGNSVGLTYSTQQGLYTRIGNIVVFEVFLQFSAKGSSTGTATLTGMPFNASSRFTGNIFAQFLTLPVAGGVPFMYTNGGTTTFDLYSTVTNSAASLLSDVSFANGTQFIITGCYLI